MDWIQSQEKKHNLLIVDDTVETHGAKFKGKKAGFFSDIHLSIFLQIKIQKIQNQLLLSLKIILQKIVKIKQKKRKMKKIAKNDDRSPYIL